VLKRFKREHINHGKGTTESNEHKSWVSPIPKKKKGKLAVYFISNEGDKGISYLEVDERMEDKIGTR